MFVPDMTSSGQLQFDIDSKRYGPGANLNGQIKIVNANLHTAGFTCWPGPCEWGDQRNADTAGDHQL